MNPKVFAARWIGVLSDAVEKRGTRNPRSRAYSMRCAMSAVAIPLRRQRGATRPPSSHASVGEMTVSLPIPTTRPHDSATKHGPLRRVAPPSKTSGIRSWPPQTVRTAANTSGLSDGRARRITRSIKGMLPQLELAGLRRRDRRSPELAAADDPVRGETSLEVRERRDGRAVDVDDEVAHLEPSALRGPPGHHFEDADTRRVRDAELVRELAADGRCSSTDPEVGPAHATIADEHARDHPRRRCGDREANSLRVRDDRGVDPDHLGVRVDERTAGVPGIERGVRLDDVLDK